MIYFFLCIPTINIHKPLIEIHREISTEPRGKRFKSCSAPNGRMDCRRLLIQPPRMLGICKYIMEISQEHRDIMEISYRISCGNCHFSNNNEYNGFCWGYGDIYIYIYNRNIAGYNLIKHSLQTNLDVEKPWFPSEDDRKWLVYRRAKSQTKELMRN